MRERTCSRIQDSGRFHLTANSLLSRNSYGCLESGISVALSSNSRPTLSECCLTFLTVPNQETIRPRNKMRELFLRKIFGNFILT
jgi:hypothetical protein